MCVRDIDEETKKEIAEFLYRELGSFAGEKSYFLILANYICDKIIRRLN